MNDFNTEVFVSHSSWGDYVEFALMGGDKKRRWVAQALECKEVNEAELIEPTFRLVRHQAQVLMDRLYSAGFRPTEMKNPTGQVEAMRSHLEDLRKLVFKE